MYISVFPLYDEKVNRCFLFIRSTILKASGEKL